MSLREVQQCCLGALKRFDSVCSELGLTYYLIGGSALGAVRHGGIIPWDDDIDVGLLRGDYECFCDNYQDDDAYTLLTMEKEPRYYNPFAKLCDYSTEYVEPTSRSVSKGVFIDVFPIDYVVDSRAAILRALCKARCYTHTFRVDLESEKYREEPLPMRIFRNATSLPYKGKDPLATASKITGSIARDTATNYLMNIWGAWGMREVVDAQWFGEGETIQFEDMWCKIPNEWDKYLRTLYGEYEKLPSDPPRRHGIAYRIQER